MNLGPYIVEHDSKIIEDPEAAIAVEVYFSGDNPETLTVTMEIEDRKKRKVEAWEAKGTYSMDDAARIAKRAHARYDYDQSTNGFTVWMSEYGPKHGKQLYREMEKFFKGKLKKVK